MQTQTLLVRFWCSQRKIIFFQNGGLISTLLCLFQQHMQHKCRQISSKRGTHGWCTTCIRTSTPIVFYVLFVTCCQDACHHRLSHVTGSRHAHGHVLFPRPDACRRSTKAATLAAKLDWHARLHLDLYFCVYSVSKLLIMWAVPNRLCGQCVVSWIYSWAWKEGAFTSRPPVATPEMMCASSKAQPRVGATAATEIICGDRAWAASAQGK